MPPSKHALHARAKTHDAREAGSFSWVFDSRLAGWLREESSYFRASRASSRVATLFFSFADQIDEIVANLGGENGGVALYVGYTAAWIVAKTFCLDPLTFLLALSSGVLFGGVARGLSLRLQKWSSLFAIEEVTQSLNRCKAR